MIGCCEICPYLFKSLQQVAIAVCVRRLPLAARPSSSNSVRLLLHCWMTFSLLTGPAPPPLIGTWCCQPDLVNSSCTDERAARSAVNRFIGESRDSILAGGCSSHLHLFSLCLLVSVFQSSTHSFTDVLNLNPAPSSGANLLIDVFSESSAPAAATDVSEENFPRWGSAAVTYTDVSVSLSRLSDAAARSGLQCWFMHSCLKADHCCSFANSHEL